MPTKTKPAEASKEKVRRGFLPDASELQPEAVAAAQNRVYTPKAIRTMRQYVGLTQDHLSKLLDVTGPTLSRWESSSEQGRAMPIMAATLLSLLVLERSGSPLTGLNAVLAYLRKPVQYDFPAASPRPKKKIVKRAPTKKTGRAKANERENPRTAQPQPDRTLSDPGNV